MKLKTLLLGAGLAVAALAVTGGALADDAASVVVNTPGAVLNTAPEPSFFDELWNMAKVPLITALVALIGAIGEALRRTNQSKWIGTAYDIAANVAAGWLNTMLAGMAPDDKAKALADLSAVASTGATPDDGTALAKAAEFMREQYPDAVKAVEVATGAKIGKGELAHDILGALGKLPGFVGLGASAADAILSRKLPKT